MNAVSISSSRRATRSPVPTSSASTALNTQPRICHRAGKDGGDPGDRPAPGRLVGGGVRAAARRVRAPGLLPGDRPRRARGAPGRDEGRRARALRPPRRRQAPQRRRHPRQRLHGAQHHQPALRGLRAHRRRRARRRRRLLRAPRRAAPRQGDRQELRGEDARRDRWRRRRAGVQPGDSRGGALVPGLAVPVPHQQVQLHGGDGGLPRRADPHGFELPHRAPGGRTRRRPRGDGRRHRRVRARGPRRGHLARQHRRHRHGMEQREAAQREASGAVRRARSTHLHRHVPARAQGRQRERTGGVRGRGPSAQVQGLHLWRLPEAPDVHRLARRRGARADGSVTSSHT